MSKLLLIDGSGLLVANYYGTLPERAYVEDGYDEIPKTNNFYSNAVFPTIKQIFDIAICSGATHLGVAFDKSRNTFRREINSDYKANRKETPIPLKEQFITCEKVLNELGIFTITDERYEADDLIGSIAKQFSLCFDEVIILTKDKDYIQLVDSNITVWMMLYKREIADEKLASFGLTKDNGFTDYLPAKVFPYTPNTVRKDKGIIAENYNQVLALAGDKADNIKGVKGVSEEVALKLIAEYNTINELYEEIEHANFSKTGKQLKQYWHDELKISRSPFNALIEAEADAKESLLLATIKTDIDLTTFNLDLLDFIKSNQDIINIYKTNSFSTFRDSIYEKVTEIIEKF